MSNVPKLRFKEFSGEWEEKKLGEITKKLVVGKTPKGGKSVYINSGVIFLRSQNVLNGNLSLEDVAFITEDENNNMKSTEVYGNDILLNVTGTSIGRSCVVPKIFAKANINQHIYMIRLKKGYNAYFIMDQILSYRIQKKISSYEEEGLNLKKIKGIVILVASLKEQNKIAKFFSLINKKIKKQQQKFNLLEQYKKNMIEKIFLKQIRFKNDNESEYPNWKKEFLGKYIIQYIRKTTKNNQYPVLTSSRKGLFMQKNYFKRQRASKNNIGYNIVPKEYFTYRHMSDDDIFYFNINNLVEFGIVSTLYPVFRTIEPLNSVFLKYYLNESKQFKKYLLFQKQGGSRTYMYFSKLKQFKIYIPCIKEQQKITNFLCKFDYKLNKEKEKLDLLKKWKKGLLEQMFV